MSINKYIENPKTKGSGIICAIPQSEICPYKCEDCFFQSGRSYLEPLAENLPNMPSEEEAEGRIVRINDGNDSNIEYTQWIKDVQCYEDRFYNTSNPAGIAHYDAPVVLTLNPGKMTDTDFYILEEVDIGPNLMFVRVRTNTWNLSKVVGPAINYYTGHFNIPVVLTFMAYHDQSSIPERHRHSYLKRKRTLNSYWAISTYSWESIMFKFRHNPLVYSCGKIEGEMGTTACSRCGNCIREFFNTKERMRNESSNSGS